MKRFMNIDLLAALRQIMMKNTVYYHDDFASDEAYIRKAARSLHVEDRTLLWMSRTSGTYCFRELDVFLKGTIPHTVWTYYNGYDTEHILSYAVELTGAKNDKVLGNLYELDYQAHVRRIDSEAILPDTRILYYSDGSRTQPIDASFNRSPDLDLGDFLCYGLKLQDPTAIQIFSLREKRHVEKLPLGNIDRHIVGLRNRLITAEAI